MVQLRGYAKTSLAGPPAPRRRFATFHRTSRTLRALRRVILTSLGGGILIAVLKFVEYKHFIRAYPTEVYGGIIALIFTGVGIYFGLRLTRRRETVEIREVIREVRIRESDPFVLNAAAVKEIAITPRELEILGLIAEGLSNREIGERLFVSENTVKTHSSRLFEKLGVNRRVQAVQKGRELGLIA